MASDPALQTASWFINGKAKWGWPCSSWVATPGKDHWQPCQRCGHLKNDHMLANDLLHGQSKVKLKAGPPWPLSNPCAAYQAPDGMDVDAGYPCTHCGHDKGNHMQKALWPLNVPCPVQSCKAKIGIPCVVHGMPVVKADGTFPIHTKRMQVAGPVPKHHQIDEWMLAFEHVAYMTFQQLHQPVLADINLHLDHAPYYAQPEEAFLQAASDLDQQLQALGNTAQGQPGGPMPEHDDEPYSQDEKDLEYVQQPEWKPESGADKPPYLKTCETCGAAPGRKCRNSKGVIVKAHVRRQLASGTMTKTVIERPICPKCGAENSLRVIQREVHSRQVLGLDPVTGTLVLAPLVHLKDEEGKEQCECLSCQSVIWAYHPNPEYSTNKHLQPQLLLNLADGDAVEAYLVVQPLTEENI